MMTDRVIFKPTSISDGVEMSIITALTPENLRPSELQHLLGVVLAKLVQADLMSLGEAADAAGVSGKLTPVYPKPYEINKLPKTIDSHDEMLRKLYNDYRGENLNYNEVEENGD